MAVVKEWKCPTCGFFESNVPVCINCGNTDVKRVFLTPPNFMSDSTKITDKNIRGLAKEYGMTDFTNNQNTKHEKPKVWQPIKGVNAADLSKFSDGSVNMDTMKPMLPGKYEAQYHQEDLKGKG